MGLALFCGMSSVDRTLQEDKSTSPQRNVRMFGDALKRAGGWSQNFLSQAEIMQYEVLPPHAALSVQLFSYRPHQLIP